MTANAIHLSTVDSDIAVLTLDVPGKSANILSSSVLDELAGRLDEVQGLANVAGLVIRSAKPGSFIAGADLREFVAMLDAADDELAELCRRGQQLFSRLSECPFVTVAAIDGTCLGGGAELAVWCDRRIMTDDSRTQIGFPEVKLGLFPGWGGTARAPRLIGLGNAVELITSGDSLSGKQAVGMGLADDVVAAEQLLDAAVLMVREECASGAYMADRKTWRQPLPFDETELMFLGATASAAIGQKTKGQYPAPAAALDMMLEAAPEGLDAACGFEAQRLPPLFGSPVNRALLNVFFLGDRIKKDRGVENQQAKVGSVESVGVIGAGIMGKGIAVANIKRHVHVVLTDASAEALETGVQDIMQEVAYNKQTGAPDVERAIRFAPLLNTARTEQQLAGCDLVVEAIIENADAKRDLLQRLEPRLSERAVLASNTSTIPVSRLAENLDRPDRFCGIHFFNPVRRMQLVEVIRGRETSDDTVATAVAYAKRIGKMPIVVNDGAGFLVNRLLFPYLNESILLLCDGVPMQQIEKAAKRFGMPMGPLTLYDVVGLDTALYAGMTMWEAFPDRVAASPLVPAMVKAKRLGQKTGAGFFRYSGKNKRGEVDPTFLKFLETYADEPKQYSQDQITRRLFLPMLLEATRVLEERLVRDVRDIDLGMIYGLGFPAFKGGLLFWADTLGGERIVEWLKPFESLGERMKATPLLLDMAAEKRKFYENWRRES